MTTVEGGAVKSERLSPSSSGGGPGGDAASSSSRSGTPSSSYPGTPPGAASRLSPTHHPPAPMKHIEAINRNYSDFMRSLAAKYNNNHPNDFFSGRNGFSGSLKAGTSPPFPGLLPPPSPVAPSAAATKEEEKTPAEAQPMLGFVPFPPVFQPVIDMNATQALLSMVRSHAGAAHQLENYLKGAAKRSPESLNSPLDLSSSSGRRQSPQLPPPTKRHKKSLGESLYGSDLVRSVSKKAVGPPGTALSPKPRKQATPARHCVSACSLEKPCSSAPDSQTIAHWSVEDVATFVTSVEMCSEYAPNFREQRIDGSALPLLTEEHLTSALGMKLGPALKLRSILSTRLGQCTVCLHCNHCHTVPQEK